MEKYRWIFKEYHIEIPEIDRKELKWEDFLEQTYKYKNKALMEIEKAYGFNGIYSFAQTVGCRYILLVNSFIFVHIFFSGLLYAVSVIPLNMTLIRSYYTLYITSPS